MAARLLAFVIWAVVAASAVFWALRLAASSPPPPPHTVAVGGTPQLRADLGRLFGREPQAAPGAPPPVAADSAFKLVGVVAPRPGSGERGGVALIAVEGKPPKPYRVGAEVDADLVLQAVHQRGATLGPRGGAASMTLELPPLPPPATGTLPAARPDEPQPPPERPAASPRMRLPPPVAAPQPPPAEPPAPVDEDVPINPQVQPPNR